MGTPPPPLLVRLGIRYFHALAAEGRPADGGDPVHVLNPEERRALRRIERGAILRAAGAGGGDLDDTRLFLEELAMLTPPEQTTVLRVLAVAAIIDGRLTRSEKRLLSEARAACGVPHDISNIERLRRAFVDGDPIDAQRIVGGVASPFPPDVD